MAKVGPLDPAVVATGLTLHALITILHIKLAKNHFKKLKPCQALKKRKKNISFLHGVQIIQGVSVSMLLLKMLSKLLTTYPN